MVFHRDVMCYQSKRKKINYTSAVQLVLMANLLRTADPELWTSEVGAAWFIIYVECKSPKRGVPQQCSISQLRRSSNVQFPVPNLVVCHIWVIVMAIFSHKSNKETRYPTFQPAACLTTVMCYDPWLHVTLM